MAINPSDIEVVDDTVKVSSSDLANGLLVAQQYTLDAISVDADLPQLRIVNVSIDSTGKVVIQNQAYADAMKAKLSAPMTLGNFICSRGGVVCW
jgi:hypothetical protein